VTTARKTYHEKKIRASDLKVGDAVKTNHGWTTVTEITTAEYGAGWVFVVTEGGWKVTATAVDLVTIQEEDNE
jgi:hypothetical protein